MLYLVKKNTLPLFFKYLFLACLYVCLRNEAISAILTVSKLSNLNFGTVIQGDNSKTIIPSNQETPYNASFKATGDQNTAYTIILPSSSTNGGDIVGRLRRRRRPCAPATL